LRWFKEFWEDQRGISVVEALLYTGVIAGVTYFAVTQLGSPLKSGASSLGNDVKTRMEPSWSS
jgi:ABC-type spermidine/putrescine transport system permease subunit II